jgi:hypothetical protein
MMSLSPNSGVASTDTHAHAMLLESQDDVFESEQWGSKH